MRKLQFVMKLIKHNYGNSKGSKANSRVGDVVSLDAQHWIKCPVMPKLRRWIPLHPQTWQPDYKHIMWTRYFVELSICYAASDTYTCERVDDLQKTLRSFFSSSVRGTKMSPSKLQAQEKRKTNCKSWLVVALPRPKEMQHEHTKNTVRVQIQCSMSQT